MFCLHGYRGKILDSERKEKKISDVDGIFRFENINTGSVFAQTHFSVCLVQFVFVSPCHAFQPVSISPKARKDIF